jgi:modulator of FtsH protease
VEAVDAAYHLEPWTDLYLGMLGAGAALTGLLVVAISVNLDKILSTGGVAERGLQTMIILLGLILLSLHALIPQSMDSFAQQTVVFGVIQTGFILWAEIRRRRLAAPGSDHKGSYFAAFWTFLPGILVVAGGASMLAESGGGLYWLAASLNVTMIAFFVNAWVLLVEILR